MGRMRRSGKTVRGNEHLAGRVFQDDRQIGGQRRRYMRKDRKFGRDARPVRHRIFARLEEGIAHRAGAVGNAHLVGEREGVAGRQPLEADRVTIGRNAVDLHRRGAEHRAGRVGLRKAHAGMIEQELFLRSVQLAHQRRHLFGRRPLTGASAISAIQSGGASSACHTCPEPMPESSSFA